MKKLLRPLAALGGLFLMTLAHTHGPAAARFRVNEVPFPESLREGCAPDYQIGASIQDINDFGVVNGNFTCYTEADPATSTFRPRSAPFIATTWFGAVELPVPADAGPSQGVTINNRGEIFGFEPVANGITGARWTLFGGHERVFYDPACDGSIQSSFANDGNGRYIVGLGLRPDPVLPPPLDTFCLRGVWLIRSPDGVESIGPPGGAMAINAFNVAVGVSDRSAISYHVPTAQVRVLHAADATHSAEAVDINDKGQAVGRIFEFTPSPGPTCNAPGIAVRWERDGSENLLPHLHGAVSSHAFGIGHDGEVVGDSGPGTGCADSNRATLWKDGRVFDLNSLIAGSAGITLTRALSINRRGQISAGGYDNDEPLTQCPSVEFVNGAPVFTVVPCRNQRMYVLTPLGR